MFALFRKPSVLPPWSGTPQAASVHEFLSILRRHSPFMAVPTVKDSAYCLVPVPVLQAAITHTLLTLTAQGVRYTANAWDCEDFVNELHQTLRKMAAIAGIKMAPVSCVIAVTLLHEFATVKPPGAHALACVNTDAGPFVIEAQNGVKCPIEEYPNRASMFEAFNL